MVSFRWVHAGVAVGLVAAGLTGISLASAIGSTSSASPSSLVPIAPCRLLDTRAEAPVGARSTPIGAGESATFAVWGHNGNCDIPTSASGIVSNVTAVNPNNASYLTLYPADVAQPLASNLNWTPASPPTPNQVTVGLSVDGAIKVFNHVGTIDVIIDIVAYTLPSSGTTNRITTAQIATKSWNLNPDTPAVINLPATTQNPYGMAFDGTNIWTANRYDSNVTRINPVTGVATTFPLPAGATWADHLAFDGTYIWTANTSTNNVTRFDVNTGAGTNFPLPAGATFPEDILFDGTHLWTANANSHNVTMITPATGAATNLPLAGVTSGPRYLGFDGINVWASSNSTAIRVNLSTLVETNFSMPVPIEGFAFDGTYLWAGHVGTTVVRVDINTGIGTAVPMPTGANSCEFAYDGQDMYGVCGSTGPNVLKFDTGFAAGEVLMGDASPWGVVYDGSHIWVNTNATGGQPARIVRLPASH